MGKWWCLSPPPPGTKPSREDVLSGTLLVSCGEEPGQQYHCVGVPRPFGEVWIIAWVEVPPMTDSKREGERQHILINKN